MKFDRPAKTTTGREATIHVSPGGAEHVRERAHIQIDGIDDTEPEAIGKMRRDEVRARARERRRDHRRASDE